MYPCEKCCDDSITICADRFRFKYGNLLEHVFVPGNDLGLEDELMYYLDTVDSWWSFHSCGECPVLSRMSAGELGVLKLNQHKLNGGFIRSLNLELQRRADGDYRIFY